MAKYLFQVTYTEKGLQAILNEGGSKRFEVLGQPIMKLGGKVEAFYFAMGETDMYLIVSLPDTVNALAFSLFANASDMIKVKTTVLLTVEDVDRATLMMK